MPLIVHFLFAEKRSSSKPPSYAGDHEVASIADERTSKIKGTDSPKKEEEPKSSSMLKDQSILQAKLTKLAVQIGYAGKCFFFMFLRKKFTVER